MKKLTAGNVWSGCRSRGFRCGAGKNKNKNEKIQNQVQKILLHIKENIIIVIHIYIYIYAYARCVCGGAEEEEPVLFYVSRVLLMGGKLNRRERERDESFFCLLLRERDGFVAIFLNSFFFLI